MTEPIGIEEVAYDDHDGIGSNISTPEFVRTPSTHLVRWNRTMPQPTLRNHAGGGFEPLVVDYNQSVHSPSNCSRTFIININ